MASSWRKKTTIILLILYWLALLFLAHIPIPQLIRRAGVSDKSLHFLAYLILTFLFWFAIKPDEKVHWHRFPVWLVLIIITLYGSIEEFVQKYIGRSCDAMDIAANLAGTLTGLILFSFLTFWPSALLVTGIVIFGITNITRANLADLLPITSAMINLFTYSIFTGLWLQNMNLLSSRKPWELKSLILALTLPTGLLLTVKIFSIMLGRVFSTRDLILSLGAISTIVSAAYLKNFHFKNQEKEYKSKEIKDSD